ncbi:MAG: hypothetical protein JJT94_17105 [Bernardetiaceae bacterium]|nr:hypothetical protein [Bernardetiaceae bacterium]
MASVWDSDRLSFDSQVPTRLMDRVVFKYPRYSEAYYLSRLSHVDTLLLAHPDSLELHLDRAASFFYLDSLEGAIESLLPLVRKKAPNYRILSSLATYYFYCYDFRRARQFLEVASRVRPLDAVDRMEYILASYALECKRGDAVRLPMQGFVGANDLARQRDPDDIENFYLFWESWQRRRLSKDSLPLSVYQEEQAIIAMSDLHRFTRPKSVLALEALADLLLGSGYGNLAATVYLQCSQIAPSAAGRVYNILAQEALMIQQRLRKNSISYNSMRLLLDIRNKDAALFSDTVRWREQQYLAQRNAAIAQNDSVGLRTLDSLWNPPNSEPTTKEKILLFNPNPKKPDLIITGLDYYGEVVAQIYKDTSQLKTVREGPVRILSAVQNKKTIYKLWIFILCAICVSLWLFFKFRTISNS